LITGESRKLSVAISLAIAAKLAFLVYYSRHLALIMDEFAHGYAARFVEQGLYTNVQPIKTALPWLAFHAALSAGGDAVSTLHDLRFQVLLVAIAMVLTVGWTAYHRYQSANAALLSMFVLLSFSNFIEHAISVRNDTFAVLFCLLSFNALLAPRRTVWSVIWSGALIGGAFLCTQKVAYHVVAIGLGHLLRAGLENGLRASLRAGLLFGLGSAISIAVYCIGFSFGGASPLHVLENVFLAPLRVSDHVLTADPFPLLGQYVSQTISRNFVPYGVCALGMLVLTLRERAQRPAVIAGIVTTGVITSLVFLHPQPWPYVFVMCMPFLAVWAPGMLVTIPEARRGLSTAALTLLLGYSFVRNVEVLDQDNAAQLAVIAQAEALLGPKDRYFDGIAMIPTHDIAGPSPWWWWDAPTLKALRAQLAAGNRDKLDAILRDQPKVWILNYRFLAMADVLTPILRESTLQLSWHILLTGRYVKAGATTHFRNHWPGAYRWSDLGGRSIDAAVTIDGMPCPTPCRVAAGEHELASTHATDVLLVPADVELPRKPAGTPRALFTAVYDF
jgi:hypothetical protein